MNNWQKAGNLEEEAHWWSDLGRYLPGGNKENYLLAVKYMQKSYGLYAQLNNKPEMAYATDDIGFVYTELLNNLDSAQFYTASSIRLLQEAKLISCINTIIIYPLYIIKRGISFKPSPIRFSQNLENIQVILAAKGNYYAHLNKFKQAERYYVRMIKLDGLVTAGRELHYTETISGSEANYTIAKFYVDNNHFQSASPYLNKFENLHHVSPIISKDLALLKFKVDSASGNYLAAIKYYQVYSKYRDSMYNIEHIGKLADMQIRYDTEQKEKDIQLLQKETQLQQRRIAQSNQLRQFAFGGIAMLGIMIAIGYNRYRLKQHSYLQEKEWLVKEVHHRVKNNLQMMKSLLRSQSYYLGNEDATLAIQTSQHRMHAMSLVHQKLYMDSRMDKIDMHEYVHELVSYLKSSFENNNKISYHLDVEPFHLNVIRAVPVGLIINEVVTNAIKYAFPDQEKGSISIFMQKGLKDITLKIADNGIGFSKGFDIDNSHSFGMTLINGLVKQLEGTLTIIDEEGLSLTIVFDSHHPIEIFEVEAG